MVVVAKEGVEEKERWREGGGGRVTQVLRDSGGDVGRREEEVVVEVEKEEV